MSSPVSPLRQLLDGRVSQLLSEAEQWAEEARVRTARDCTERLNQAVRRIRQSASLTELVATVVDATVGFATAAALFVVEGKTAGLEHVRGLDNGAGDPLRAGVPLSAAPALASAIETRDPVIAAATPGEISVAVAEALGHRAEDRVSILPIVSRNHVPAILYAWGQVDGSALELLAQVAAATWIALEPVPPAPASLVTIARANPDRGWDALPRADQQIHLGAQRFARVRVAEMRLQHPEDVRTGRARRSLYASLREPIDGARVVFRQKFFATCPSMVDYLHLELVGTLAHDDPEVLGQDYPGPLV